MKNPCVIIDEFLYWLKSTPYSNFSNCIRFFPVELCEYEDFFTQVGFNLPDDFKHLLKDRGRLMIADISGLTGDFAARGIGFEVMRPQDLFAGHLHLQDAVESGVKQAAEWLLFATSRGDFDGAFVFDRRFGSSSNEVGFYHQDQVCTNKITKNQHLPECAPDLTSWLEIHLKKIRVTLEKEDPVVVDNLLKKSLRSLDSEERLGWQYYLERIDSGNGSWRDGPGPAWRTIIRETDDLSVVRRVINEYRLVEKKKANSPPYTYPSPLDLIYRLKKEGPWGRRDLVRWALSKSDYVIDNVDLKSALRYLEEISTNEKSIDNDVGRAHIKRCLALLKDGGKSVKEFKQRSFARALLWALGQPLAEQIYKSLNEAMLVCEKLNNDVIWEKLELIVFGKPDEEPYVLRDKPNIVLSLLYQEFEKWLTSCDLPQRKIIDEIQSKWIQRLKTTNDQEKESIRKLIRKTVNSKKVSEERERVIEDIYNS